MFIQKELITDLDLLLSQVLNPNSRQHATEAIACFRAGSYRAAILSTWVALTYDLIHKIRDIASVEGGEAQKFIDSFDINVANETIDKLLKVERDILQAAKTFELISNREFYELVKLKEDRHRCAHPSFSSEDELFQPSPEQVRFNIVNALSFVLIQKPIQGKKAIERMINFTQSSNFPDDYVEAKKILDSQYLRSTKHSIVGNVAKILLKEIIRTDWSTFDKSLKKKYLFVLKAIFESDVKATTSIFNSVLSSAIDTADELTVLNSVAVVWIDVSLWNCIALGNRQLVQSLISRGKADKTEHLLDCLSVSELIQSVSDRLKEMPNENLKSIADLKPEKALKEYLIDRFCSEPNFTKTRDFGNMLAGTFSKYLSAADVQRILKSSINSNQIWGYYYADQIMKDLFRNTRGRLLEDTKNDWQIIGNCGHFKELKTFLLAEGAITDESAQPAT